MIAVALLLLVHCSLSLRSFRSTTTLCDASTDYRNGRWLCESVGDDAMTTPRNERCAFAPFGCRFARFERDELLRQASLHYATRQRALWLYVAGDSRSRGLWLHLIDLLLESANLTTSQAFKCWGRSDFRAPQHHLRLTWHDVRAQSDDPTRAAASSSAVRDAVRRDFDDALRWSVVVGRLSSLVVADC